MSKYLVDSKVDAELVKRFTYHSPKSDQPERYEAIRAAAYNLSVQLTANCPQSRELALALTKLEESVMWANAAISRNE